MDKRIVITGFGVISPEVKENKLDENPFHLCGRLEEEEVVNKRLRKKIDNFCVNGLLAVDKALKMSGLNLKTSDQNEIGISVGNCLGGWKYIENEVIKLHEEGVQSVSPYLATAWFPAALQGQISLKYGMKGFSKTFSMSDVAGMQAIGYAAEAIRQGKCNVMIAGASEDLSSDFVKRLLKNSYKKATSKSILGRNRTEFFADGAVFFVLEDLDFASSREADILCEISGFMDTSLQASEQIHNFYEQSFINRNKKICYIDGLFEHEDTLILKNFLHNDVEMISTKATFGNQFAVGGLMDIVLAIKRMSEDQQKTTVVIQRVNYMERLNTLVLENNL